MPRPVRLINVITTLFLLSSILPLPSASPRIGGSTGVGELQIGLVDDNDLLLHERRKRALPVAVALFAPPVLKILAVRLF